MRGSRPQGAKPQPRGRCSGAGVRERHPVVTVRGQSPREEPQARGRTRAHHASRLLLATFVTGHFSRCPLAPGLHQPWGYKDVWCRPGAAGAIGGSAGAEQPTHLAPLPSWHLSHLLVISGLRGPILTPRALTGCWWGPGSPEHRTDAGALSWVSSWPPRRHRWECGHSPRVTGVQEAEPGGLRRSGPRAMAGPAQAAGDRLTPCIGTALPSGMGTTPRCPHHALSQAFLLWLLLEASGPGEALVLQTGNWVQERS